MNFLALDLGTTTGYCALINGVKTHDTVSFKPSRFSGGGERFLRFARWLDANIPRSPCEVSFEEVRRHRGTDAAHVYGGLLAVLTAHCEEHKIPYTGYPVGEIKKFWTGKGNADKSMMMTEAAKRGFQVKDDNEADAIAILHLHLQRANWTETTDAIPSDISDLW